MRRLLFYYVESKFEGRVILGDSSDPGAARYNAHCAAEVSSKLAVEYLPLPGMPEWVATQRMLDSVATAYSLLLPDDDLVTVLGMHECAAFLDTNPDYVGAHGSGVFFSLDVPGPYGSITSWGRYILPECERSSPMMRVCALLANYSVSLFSVFRTETWRAMMTPVGPGLDRTFAAELIPCIMSAALGKIKGLDGLYLFRQLHGNRYSRPSVNDWLFSPTWMKNFLILRDAVSQSVQRGEGMKSSQVHHYLHLGFGTYLARRLSTIADDFPDDQTVEAVSPVKRGLCSITRSLPGYSVMNRLMRFGIGFARHEWGRAIASVKRIGSGPRIDPLSRQALGNPISPGHQEFLGFQESISFSGPSLGVPVPTSPKGRASSVHVVSNFHGVRAFLAAWEVGSADRVLVSAGEPVALDFLRRLLGAPAVLEIPPLPLSLASGYRSAVRNAWALLCYRSRYLWRYRHHWLKDLARHFALRLYSPIYAPEFYPVVFDLMNRAAITTLTPAHRGFYQLERVQPLTAEQERSLRWQSRGAGGRLDFFQDSARIPIIGLAETFPELPIGADSWSSIRKKFGLTFDRVAGKTLLFIDMPIQGAWPAIRVDESRARLANFFSQKIAAGFAVYIKPHYRRPRIHSLQGTSIEDQVVVLDHAFPSEIVVDFFDELYAFTSATLFGPTDRPRFSLVRLLSYSDPALLQQLEEDAITCAGGPNAGLQFA